MTTTLRIPKTELTGVQGSLLKMAIRKKIGRVPDNVAVMWNHPAVFKDLMRATVSIREGAISSTLLLKRLRSGSKKNATCTAFYRKNMTGEVTSLSPEPVTGFILSRKWFRLSDYRLLK